MYWHQWAFPPPFTRQTSTPHIYSTYINVCVLLFEKTARLSSQQSMARRSFQRLFSYNTFKQNKTGSHCILENQNRKRPTKTPVALKRVNGNPRPAFTLQVQNKDMHVSKAFCLLQTYFINLVSMHHYTIRLQIFEKRVSERSNAPGLWILFWRLHFIKYIYFYRWQLYVAIKKLSRVWVLSEVFFVLVNGTRGLRSETARIIFCQRYLSVLLQDDLLISGFFCKMTQIVCNRREFHCCHISYKQI